jgi:hypothetical protein
MLISGPSMPIANTAIGLARLVAVIRSHGSCLQVFRLTISPPFAVFTVLVSLLRSAMAIYAGHRDISIDILYHEMVRYVEERRADVRAHGAPSGPTQSLVVGYSRTAEV